MNQCCKSDLIINVNDCLALVYKTDGKGLPIQSCTGDDDNNGITLHPVTIKNFLGSGLL